MSRSQADRHSLVRALAVSVALHLLCAPLFVVASVSSFEAATAGATRGATGETMTVSSITISRRAGRPAQRAPSATRAPARPHVARDLAALAPKPAARAKVARAVDRDEHRAGSRRAAVVALTIATAEPERATVVPKPTASRRAAAPAAPIVARPTQSPTPTATPATVLATATPAPRVVAERGVEAPPGGWGQSFERPLIADDGALADLRARYRGAHPITVDVDESGRATRVVIGANLPDDARAELERSLLAMHYVPAECNGLRCTGTLLLSL